MAAQPHRQLYTLEEYLDLEIRAEHRSEFHAGNIYARSGGSEPHSRLAARAGIVLDRHFPACRVYDSNLKLYIEAFEQCVYPDAMLLCGGDPVFWGKRTDALLNPTLVVEVLSPRTEKHDRGPKSDYYRSVPSLQQILLLSQEKRLIEQFERKSDDMWTVTRYGAADYLTLLTGQKASVSEFYHGIL